MAKILLVSENKDLRELLSFQLTSKNSVEVKESESAKEAAEQVLATGAPNYELIIFPWEGAQSPLVAALQNQKHDFPVILLPDAKASKPAKGELKGLVVLGEVSPGHLAQDVSQLVQDFLQKGGAQADVAEEFCPIRTNLLIRATPLKSDIFIRLSKTKFVKLFATGDEFDTHDLERYYQAKKVEYLYLRRQEVAEFIQKFSRELDELLARTDLKQEEVFQEAEMSQETVHELVQKIGFTEEVQELAKKNIDLTLKAIGSNPRLAELINRIIGSGNYISQHSTLLAHVACCVAKEMEWGSESTFSKLVLAAYMHDISVTEPELARINTLKELAEKGSSFSEESVKSYHLHPARSADMVRSFKEIPADVDVIVQQHHERPNGSGFPRGLSHNYIAPLGAVFIVAHDMAQYILEERENFNLAHFVDEKKPFFNQGNFKKVIVALEKVKL